MTSIIIDDIGAMAKLWLGKTFNRIYSCNNQSMIDMIFML